MNHRKHLERILSWAWLIIIFLAERKWEGWTNLIIWRSEWSLSEWWEQWRRFEFVLSLLWSGDTANMTSRPAEGCFYLDISIFLASFMSEAKTNGEHISTRHLLLLLIKLFLSFWLLAQCCSPKGRDLNREARGKRWADTDHTHRQPGSDSSISHPSGRVAEQQCGLLFGVFLKY